MQGLSTELFYWQWLSAVLSPGVSAAAGLPVITAFALLAARRGHARLCAAGARRMAGLNLGLAALGPLLTVGGLLALLAGLRGTERMLEDIAPWNPAFMPYTSSALAWLAGMACLCLYLVAHRAAPMPEPEAPAAPKTSRGARGRDASGAGKQADKQPPAQTASAQWQGRHFRWRMLCSLLAALCFFAAQALAHWPFAALPQGLTLGQAVTAVLSATAHNSFASLAPAGGAALLLLPLLRALPPKGINISAHEEQLAARWCALWALVGYIPRCVDRWGLLAGFALRGGNLPAWMASQALPLAALTLAIACWGILFALRTPRNLYWLNWLALLLLALRESLPFLLHAY